MKEKKVKVVHIKWEDFFKDIKLFRVISPDTLKYRGEYHADEKIYEDEYIFSAETYHTNKDQMGYIDKFAKEQIAKKLVQQINRKKK